MLTGSVADEITRRLQLNTEYYHPGTFHKAVAYGVELPVTVELPDLGQAESASFSLQLRKDSTIRISSMVLNDKALDGSLTFSMGKPVKTPLGIITVKPSPYYREGFQDELTISRIPFSTASARIRSSVDARQRNNRASIIDITYSDQSRTRAEDILSTLVAVYNENWIKDRNGDGKHHGVHQGTPVDHRKRTRQRGQRHLRLQIAQPRHRCQCDGRHSALADELIAGSRTRT